MMIPLPAHAQDESALILQSYFGKANAAYAEQDYTQAAQLYVEAVEASGEASTALWFNLGNSYYHLQDYPRALLAYEKALILEPGNPDVLANLQHCLDEGGLTRPQFHIIHEFFYSLSVSVWSLLLVTGAAVTTLAVLAHWFFRRIRPIPSLILFIAIPLTLLSTTALILWQGDFDRGLTLVPNTELRVAPTETANSLDQLQPGIWLTVVRKHERFLYVRTSDKREGWVDTDKIGLVWPD